MTCETLEVTVTESPRNAWRQTTPGPAGWARSPRPDDPNKYFMVSADCHANEPASYLAEHIEPEYLSRIPHLEVRDDGSQYSVTEGNRPMMIRPPDAVLASGRAASASTSPNASSPKTRCATPRAAPSTSASAIRPPTGSTSS